MAAKKYNEFPSGTYDVGKIFLQADPVSGSLEKINLPPIGIFAGAGTPFTTYSAGDIIIASATNTLSRLTAGTNGYVLTISSGLPVWAVPNTGWALTGNSGTSPATNFIGTSDAQDVIFKTNNIRRGAFLAAGGFQINNTYIGIVPYLSFGVLSPSSAELFITGGLSATSDWGAGYSLTFGTASNRILRLTSAGVAISNLTLSGNLAIANTLSVAAGSVSFGSASGFAQIFYSGSHLWNFRILNNATSILTADTAGRINSAPSGASVVSSAAFSISSTSYGFLPPRMSTAQKNAISSPAAGLIVFDTSLAKLCVYTSAWEVISST